MQRRRRTGRSRPGRGTRSCRRAVRRARRSERTGRLRRYRRRRWCRARPSVSSPTQKSSARGPTPYPRGPVPTERLIHTSAPGVGVAATITRRDMAKVCHSCGKRPAFGNSRSHSMTATRRRFNPNLQKVRIKDGAADPARSTSAPDAEVQQGDQGRVRLTGSRLPMADPSIERFRRVVSAASAHLEDRRQEVNDLNVFPGRRRRHRRQHGADPARRERRAGPARRPDGGRDRPHRAGQRAREGGADGGARELGRDPQPDRPRRGGGAGEPARRSWWTRHWSQLRWRARPMRPTTRSASRPRGRCSRSFREMAHSVAKRLAHMDQTRLDPDATEEEQDALLAALLEEAVRDGERAVERTPEQLEVLRDSGVVDAGSARAGGDHRGDRGRPPGRRRGLAGGRRTTRRPPTPARTTRTAATATAPTSSSPARVSTGRSFVPLLEELGDSVLVVGDEATLKVHVHTDEPEAAVALFEGSGAVSKLDVADMREQIAERSARLQAGRCGVVAVASGAGVTRALREPGGVRVDGGATFNPSIYDLLAAIHEVPSGEVLVLPNNPNVVMAAERAAELSDKQAQGGPVHLTAGRARWRWSSSTPRRHRRERRARRRRRWRASGRGSVAPAARDDAQGRFVPGTRSASSGTRSSRGAAPARPSPRRWRGPG